MGLGSRTAIAVRFEAYVGELTKVIGMRIGRGRCGIIALGCWRRKAGAAWSRWRW